MPVYNLNETGKQITWKSWLKDFKGCGLSAIATLETSEKIKAPRSVWIASNVTLGQIAEASKLAEREIAGYMVHLKKPENTIIEYP
jgi:hypothetical protein